MKYLISMHYTSPHIGGMEEIAKKQTASLHQLGQEVKLLTCRHDKSLPLSENLKTHKVRRFKALNFIENKFGVTYPIISPFAFFEILKESRDADIIHVHDVFYGLSHLSGIAAIIAKKPLYITQHVAMVEHPSKLVMYAQKGIYRTIGKYLFNKSRAIIVYNVNVRNFLIKLGIDKDKIHLMNNGIDTRYYSPCNPAEKPKLKYTYNLPIDKPIALYVGRLVPKKGFDLVANANSDSYISLIVGNGNIPKKLENRKNVIFFGPANDKQLLDLYRLSDVFVFPAIGEIFTLVMQEAMACGLPIITTNDKGYDDYQINNRLLKLVDRSSIKIKMDIKEILGNPALITKMSKYSRGYANDHFNWETNYSKEYAIYSEVISS